MQTLNSLSDWWSAHTDRTLGLVHCLGQVLSFDLQSAQSLVHASTVFAPSRLHYRGI